MAFIDTNKITDLDDLKSAIMENNRIASSLRDEIRKSKTILFGKLPSSAVIPSFESEEKSVGDTNSFLDEYDYYYDEIKQISSSCDDNNLKELIRDNLPSKKNKYYFYIVGYIKRKIFDDIIDYTKMMKESEDKEFNLEIQCEIDFLTKKLYYVDNWANENNMDDLEENKNKVVFLRSSSDKICVVEDLSSIPSEFYPDIMSALNSIVDGTFKSIKRFKDGVITNVTEVRNSDIRILFDRLSSDTYVILQIFVKKTDGNSIYVTNINSRLSKYLVQKDYIKKLAMSQDETFVKRGECELQEFLEMLSSPKRELRHD